MLSVKHLLKKPYRALRALWKQRQTSAGIASLQRHDTPSLRALGRVLEATRNHTTTAEERVWIERIEALRVEVKADSTTLALRYFDQDTPQMETVGSLPASSFKWGLFFLKLIRECRPTHCLEMGTSLGFSAAYQAAALELNQHGRLITIEGEPSVAALGQKHLAKLGLERVVVHVGWFQERLLPALRELSSVDLVYIDGHHQERPTLDYFDQIFPFLTEQAIIIFDDIHWSSGMERAWDAITADRRIGAAVDLGKLGVCFLARGAEAPQLFKITI